MRVSVPVLSFHASVFGSLETCFKDPLVCDSSEQPAVSLPSFYLTSLNIYLTLPAGCTAHVSSGPKDYFFFNGPQVVVVIALAVGLKQAV